MARGRSSHAYVPGWLSKGGALCAALASACQPTGAVHSALADDLPQLRASIVAEQKAGTLDDARARDISQALLERELHTAKTASDVGRVRGLRPCAGSLTSSLRERAKIDDDIGGEAALILFERHDLTAPLSRYARAENGAFRAVAARDTEGPKAAGQRLAYFLDPDERVRRTSLQAAGAAHDARDLDALLEVARVDPDPMSRSLAISAIGRIGGERAVLGLKDRWERADEAQRLAIVDAWAAPASFATGGRGALVNLAETSDGILSIQAARALSRSDQDVRELGAQKLLSSARSGSREERRMALTLLPADHPETKGELAKAAKDADAEVRVLALARQLDFDATRESAQKELASLAGKADGIAVQARAALAAYGDASVTPLLQKQLEDPRSAMRENAALGLIRLKRADVAAILLADPSPSVRTRVACQMLSR